METQSKSSTRSSRTISEPTTGEKELEEKNRDVEKEAGNEPEKQLPEAETPLERDEDGVAIENGVPIVRLKGPDDPDSPLNMSLLRRWMIVIIVSSCGFCVTSASSMIVFTNPQVEQEFQVSREVATLGLSLFVFALGLFPLIVAPLSQWYGRTPIYVVGFTCFLAFQGGVAASQNIQTLLICRFFAGAGGAAFLSVAGGTVADVFRPAHVGSPMTCFSASTFLGPTIGPIISGFINQHANWRVTWYTLAGWGGLELIALILFVPETFLPVVLKYKAQRLRKAGRTDVRAPIELDERSITAVLRVSCTQPFELLATEPMALMLCMHTALLLGLLYMFFSAFALVYGEYGFEMQYVGLSYAPLGIGIVIGWLCQPLWARQYANKIKKLGRRPPPEEHLRRGIVGAIFCCVSIFAFAWTAQPSVHWIVPMICTVPFGTGMLFSYQSVFIYLVDAFRPIAASSMAANSATRSMFAAAFPLFTTYMFGTLGNQWSLTLCAFLLLAIVPFPILFFKRGHQYRKGSKFANQED
ncbi:MFS transporter [Sporobolomyces salmoneus]|uniref:MFS transporter n=1 Tax=Sporobolomyces salmoneus TaxID=183962 RepID=UPI0031701D6A